MEFRILGPLEAYDGDRPVSLGGARQRALLAMLLVHANEVVATDQLVSELWGEPPPAEASKTLQVTVSRLRKTLEPQREAGQASQLLVTRPPGYELRVEPEELDLDRFEQAASDGRQTLEAGDPASAADRLREALAIWRGPPLADLVYESSFQGEINRLEELRLAAHEDRLRADLELGRHAELIGELENLVTRHPLRERLRAQLMLALYRCGRQAEALEAYADARRALVEELGIDPSPELEELQRSILGHDPSLELDEASDAPKRAGREHAARSSEDIPLPSRLSGTPALDFVGRVRERQRVEERWSTARGGLRQAVLVAGEPGIGKTRFATQAACELHEEGAIVLFGHCAEELNAPYGAWAQALSHLVEHAPDDILEPYVERHGGELTRLVPALARLMPEAPAATQTDPETERYLLFSAVVGLLGQAGSVAPVVLLLDDLHWADAQTLALVKHVLAELQDAPLLLLCTYRDSDLSRDHPLTRLLADLRGEEGVERLSLRGLSEDDVFSIMEAVAGQELGATGQSLAREITAETGGNPFFAGEILRHLAESEAVLQGPDGRWELIPKLDELGLPQSVREVVARRVEGLGEECHAALSCAAVIGRDFDVELLLPVARKDEDELIDLLDTAVEAALLQERSDRPGSFSFAHNLISHTLYDALGPTRRARLHRRVAEALEQASGDDPTARVAELARHWSAATTPVDSDKALAYTKQAGERALAELAPDEAVRWFSHAIELLDGTSEPEPAKRCELAIGLGEAQRQAGRPEFRTTLLDASRLAEELGDADRLARAALANNRGFASAFGAVDRERVAALERAIELDRPSNPARCARLLSLHAMELQFDHDHRHRRALADEALALAREAGDEDILPYVLRDHFHAVWAPDTLATRRRTAEEMTALAEHADDPLAGIWALDRTVHAELEAGQLAKAERALAQLRERTDQLGQPGLRWHATYYASGIALMRGELEEAERLAAAASSLGEQAGESDRLLIYFSLICELRVEQGRADEVIELLEQSAAANTGIPAWEAGLAIALCELGREPEAGTRLERAAGRRFADIPRDQVCSTALALWARIAADVGSERAAGPLYELIEPWRDQLVWNGATGYGSAESHLGMLAATLGSHDRANEHFAAASSLHGREGIKATEARSLYYWARSLLAAGDADHARSKARQALSLARENGYGSSARRAEALLETAATA